MKVGVGVNQFAIGSDVQDALGLKSRAFEDDQVQKVYGLYR